MKKFIVGLLCFSAALALLTLPACIAGAAPVTETDAYIDPLYDFSEIKSLCPWPVSMEEVPDIVSLSLPMRVDYWVEKAIEANRGSNSYVVKSPNDVWRDVWFIRGPFDFGDPFADEHAEKIFYSNLDGACSAVLKTSLTIRSERKWQEPSVEYYWTTVTVSSMSPRRSRRGGMIWVEVEREIPVRRQRTVPGYWYTVASVRCDMELYDTDDTDNYVASVKASGEDSGKQSEKQVVDRMVKKTVEDAVAAMFNTKLK